MKRQLITLALFMLGLQICKAQFVTIPDPAFRAYLQRSYPLCFNSAGLMDTVCVKAEWSVMIEVPNLGITSLEGIQYFYNVASLNAQNNLLTTIPVFNYVATTCLVNLSNNRLTSLPLFPDNSIFQLDCSRNNFTTMPILPRGIDIAFFHDNAITNVTSLPNSLSSLVLINNQLTSISSLPPTLGVLMLENNSNLSCLPLLPASLATWSFQNTNIQCLPNYTSNINFASTNLPLCTSTNPNCQSSPMARGFVYSDVNNNGTRDINESDVPDVPVLVSPSNWTGVSNGTNGYIVELDRTPTVNVIRPGVLPYRTFSPASYNVTATGNTVLPTSYNFGMVSQPNITDLVSRLSIWSRVSPGFSTTVTANVENIGTIDQSNATISVEVPNGFNITSIVPANGVANGNTVTWSGVNINIFERKNFQVVVLVPLTAQLGTMVNYAVNAIPATTDFTPVNNTSNISARVRGPYDPNDKQVNKVQLAPNYNAADEELLYNVRFQNTGNDTAFTVIVRDTLDLTKLDFTTFRFIGASHPVSVNARENGLLEFVFNNIMLVDSATNELLSHGYLQFAIHPKAGLQVGAQIRNKVSIYFDFNAPIVTNFATTTIALSVNVAINVTTTNVSCFGLSDATATAIASGGTSYSYLWSNGETTQSISGLAAGPHFVTVTDVSGSTSTSSVVVTSPSAISVTTSSSMPTCFGLSDGTATVNVSGGTANYSYRWSNNETTASVNNLNAATHSYTVTDGNGCQRIGSFTLSQPAALRYATLPLAYDSPCAGACEGGINGASVIGGTPPYSYLWTNGANIPNVSGLCAGIYNVSVFDSNGCSLILQNAVTVSQASPLQVSTTVTDASANGVSDGSVLVSVSGGTPPYTNTGLVSGLAAGNYTISVVDANNCVGTVNVVVSEPSGLGTLDIISTMSLSPNPAIDNLQFQMELKQQDDVTLTLFSSNGQLITLHSFGVTQTIDHEISLSSLPSGMYMLRLNVGTNAITRTIMKQ